jgi:hypothetical protein
VITVIPGLYKRSAGPIRPLTLRDEEEGRPYTPWSLAKDVGSMAAFTVPFEAPGHMYDAYRTSRKRGGKFTTGMRAAGRSIASKRGLSSLAGKTGKSLMWLAKTAPKWGLMFGLPIAGLSAYAGLKGRGEDATIGNMAGGFGKELESEGKRFGAGLGKDPGVMNAAAAAGRGFLFEPVGGLSYLYQRAHQALGGPKVSQ